MWPQPKQHRQQTCCSSQLHGSRRAQMCPCPGGLGPTRQQLPAAARRTCHRSCTCLKSILPSSGSLVRQKSWLLRATACCCVTPWLTAPVLLSVCCMLNSHERQQAPRHSSQRQRLDTWSVREPPLSSGVPVQLGGARRSCPALDLQPALIFTTHQQVHGAARGIAKPGDLGTRWPHNPLCAASCHKGTHTQHSTPCQWCVLLQSLDSSDVSCCAGACMAGHNTAACLQTAENAKAACAAHGALLTACCLAAVLTAGEDASSICGSTGPYIPK